MDRRDFLAVSAAALATPSFAAAAPGFTLPPLPYPFDALEPHIDAKTMEIHHDKHHKAYVDNLNKALGTTEWANKPIEDILRDPSKLPDEIRQTVINNGGGHYNHSLFWQTMAKKGGQPSADFLKAWGADLELLKKTVKATATSQFGSGWGWVVWVPAEKKVSVVATANQDCPLSYGWFPLFGVDVWEHAYYLKYQNKRADYVDAWWNVVNWEAVDARFKVAMKA